MVSGNDYQSECRARASPGASGADDAGDDHKAQSSSGLSLGDQSEARESHVDGNDYQLARRVRTVPEPIAVADAGGEAEGQAEES